MTMAMVKMMILFGARKFTHLLQSHEASCILVGWMVHHHHTSFFTMVIHGTSGGGGGRDSLTPPSGGL